MSRDFESRVSLAFGATDTAEFLGSRVCAASGSAIYGLVCFSFLCYYLLPLNLLCWNFFHVRIVLLDGKVAACTFSLLPCIQIESERGGKKGARKIPGGHLGPPLDCMTNRPWEHDQLLKSGLGKNVEVPNQDKSGRDPRCVCGVWAVGKWPAASSF